MVLCQPQSVPFHFCGCWGIYTSGSKRHTHTEDTGHGLLYRVILVSLCSLGLDTSWFLFFLSVYIHPHITQQRLLLLQHTSPITQLTVHPPGEYRSLIPNDTRKHWKHIDLNPGVPIALSHPSRSMKMEIIHTAGANHGYILACGHFKLHHLHKFDPLPWHASISIS